MKKAAVAATLGLILITVPVEAEQRDLPVAGVTSELIQYLSTPIKELEEKNIVEASESSTEMSVPSDNAFKSFMDARFITSKSTPQYKLKARYELSVSGIYTVDGRYCVAVGSYYCTDIGTKLDLIMDNGSTVECILADCKDNKDTDYLHRQNANGSIVEFIVSERWLNPEAKRMGDCSYCFKDLEGEIKAIRVYE